MLKLAPQIIWLTLLSGCCIPFPIKSTVTPELHGRVIANGNPVSGAEVVLTRYVYYPHFQRQSARRSIRQTARDGGFDFELRTERKWAMPLMIHGVPGYGWQTCVEVDGYATDLREVNWHDEPVVEVTIELKTGERTPCTDLLGQGRDLPANSSVASPELGSQ